MSQLIIINPTKGGDALYNFMVVNNTVKIPQYRVEVKEAEDSDTYPILCESEEESLYYKNAYPESEVIPIVDPPTWMDGIQVSGENSWEQAVSIYEMGEEAYKASLKREQSTNPEQLRADLDYVMLMGGY